MGRWIVKKYPAYVYVVIAVIILVMGFIFWGDPGR